MNVIKTSWLYLTKISLKSKNTYICERSLLIKPLNKKKCKKFLRQNSSYKKSDSKFDFLIKPLFASPLPFSWQ